VPDSKPRTFTFFFWLYQGSLWWLKYGAQARIMGVDMSRKYQQDTAVEAEYLQDEMILFHPQSNQFYILNHTASVIWSRLAQPATTEEIAAEISTQFAGVTAVDALQGAEQALQQMIDQQLITQV
jgi:hypothetical protein